MDIISGSDVSVHTRKWAAISLLENVTKHRKRQEKPIDDAHIPKRQKTEFFPNRHKGRRRYKEKDYFMISPECILKVYWNTLKILLLMIESILIPYILSFNPSNILLYQHVIEFIELLFIFDIIMSFNTEIYYNGILFSNRLFIAKQYIKSWFLIDFISSIPFQYIFDNANLTEPVLYISATNTEALKFLWLLKLLRLFEAKKLVYQLEDYLVSSILLIPLRAFKFLFGAFIWTHWLSCIIYAYYARGLEIEPKLWSRFYEVTLDMYLRNVYLVLQTMTSVGYGDILPITNAQHIIAIVSMCFACVLFGNIIGNIQGFIENYNADGRYYEDTARRLKKYLKINKLPSALRLRIIQYIYYLKRISKKNDQKEMGILDNLSFPLREEIFTQTRGYLLAKSAVFMSYSGSFLKYLSYQMKIEAFAPGDLIFKEGEMSAVIYYLCGGLVQIYHEDTKTVFKDIKKSKYFGEIAFFLNKPRTASAMCLKFSEFLTLDRSVLFNVLYARPKEMEITNVIIHNTEKYNNLSLLGIRCYLCRKLGHVAKNCNEFIYVPNKSEAIKKAEARKYFNQKNVNLNLTSPNNFPRQDTEYNPFIRYDAYNTLGQSFTPGTKYQNYKQIISRAWSLEGKRATALLNKRLVSIQEQSNESDSSNSSSASNTLIGLQLRSLSLESSFSASYKLTLGK